MFNNYKISFRGKKKEKQCLVLCCVNLYVEVFQRREGVISQLLHLLFWRAGDLIFKLNRPCTLRFFVVWMVDWLVWVVSFVCLLFLKISCILYFFKAVHKIHEDRISGSGNKLI